MPARWLIAFGSALLLAASVTATGQAEMTTGGVVQAAYVLMAGDGQAVARAVTTAAPCPALDVDGRALGMSVRAASATLPLRPTASRPEYSKPSAFPVTICEAVLPRHALRASIAGHALPLPKTKLSRIVVIGDTGCRLKAADNAYQACNDPRAYPFRRIAERAAAWHPDLVIHVGDYLYRENPCAGHPGCEGSPWGYGWDAWDADFFAPGSALLAAAPWAVTRGNHENCVRAGQGWWRLLDPRPLEPHRDCVDPADDAIGDYSPPYAVGLGSGAQLVLMDLSHAGNKKIRPDDPRYAQFIETHDALARFASKARFTFTSDHYPIFGVTIPDEKPEARPRAGNKAIRSTFGAVDPRIVPPGVDVLLAGHVHLWEHVDYSGDTPSQFITGFSGTEEDAVPLPATLPPGISPLSDTTIRQFQAWTHGFGYMTLQRTGATRWIAEVHDVESRIVHRCSIRGHHSRCTR